MSINPWEKPVVSFRSVNQPNTKQIITFATTDDVTNFGYSSLKSQKTRVEVVLVCPQFPYWEFWDVEKYYTVLLNTVLLWMWPTWVHFSTVNMISQVSSRMSPECRVRNKKASAYLNMCPKRNQKVKTGSLLAKI